VCPIVFGFVRRDMPVFKKQPARSARTILNELVERVNTDTERLRVLEKTVDSISSRMNSVEQALIEERKSVRKSLAEADSMVSKLDDRIAGMEKILKEVIDRLKKTVTKPELEELEKIIEIYNPLKSNFMTREEVEALLNEKLKINK